MSKFSIYLENIIRRSGEPIARIAKNAGLERTSIHKALKDERILPYPALKKLIQYFQLTLPEARELNLYYDILLQGEEVYSIQNEICQMLSDLNHLHFTSFNYKTELSDNLDFSSKMIQGKSEVEYTIQAILHKETETPGTEINLYLAENTHLFDTFIQFWRNGKEFSVNQIISFRPNSSDKNNSQQNVHIIRTLLPIALLSNSQYFAYYCFMNDETNGNLQPFPYFINTPHYAIALNHDCSAAYINTDQTLIHFQQKHFEQIKNECQPLITYADHPINILASYMDNTDQAGYFTMMTQPCIGRYYTREIIEKYMRKDLPYRRELIELGVQRFSALGQLNSNYYTVFTESGIAQFVKDGVIADLPPEQVLPLDPPDRLNMLKQLKEDIIAENVCGYIADINQLAIPPYLTFTCDPRFGLHIYAVNGFVGGSYSCNLHISAANVGKVFCDFIRFLPNSKYVYSKEQTVSILDHYISKLETNLENESL